MIEIKQSVFFQEIELHKKEQEELEKSNQELEHSVRKMLRDPKSNVRQQMFPEFFPGLQKYVQKIDGPTSLMCFKLPFCNRKKLFLRFIYLYSWP